MTFGDSKMTSRELQNDLRRLQNELQKSPESPSGTQWRPAEQPKPKIANRLRGNTISGTQQGTLGGSAP